MLSFFSFGFRRTMAATGRTFEGWKCPGGSSIPAPSGSYTVGCVDMMHNDLLVRLTYPTSPDSVGQFEYAKWLPHPKYLKAYLSFMKETGLISKRLFETVRINDTILRSPALMGAPLIEGSATPHQVIVLSHGLGGIRTIYSGICCDMASHGYVVAAVEHHDRSAALSFRRMPGPGVEEGQYDQYTEEWIKHEFGSFTDFEFRNSQVLQRSREVSQTLDLLQLLNSGGEVHNKMGGNFDFSAFNGRLDLNKAAVMGHSFGGATAVQVLHDDTRFKCGIGMDTWMLPISKEVYKTGVSQPLLFINSFDFHWRRNMADMMALVNQGTHHFNQCDVNFVLPRRLIVKSPLNEVTAHKVNLGICYDFYKRHLLHDPAYQGSVPNLDGGEGADENILFGTNVDYRTEGEDSNNPIHLLSKIKPKYKL